MQNDTTEALSSNNLARRVSTMLRDCLFREEEIPADGSIPSNAVVVETIRGKLGFHAARLEACRPAVCEIILLLDPAFHRTGEGAGHGYSFLGLCQLANGDLWGQHDNCDELLALAFGLKLGGFLMPRMFWSALPGGMPYLWLDINGEGASDVQAAV